MVGFACVSLFWFSFESGSHSKAPASLKIMILLPHSPKCRIIDITGIHNQELNGEFVTKYFENIFMSVPRDLTNRTLKGRD